jgi:hypothetical protein
MSTQKIFEHRFQLVLCPVHSYLHGFASPGGLRAIDRD